jgi:hypothetical protein
MRRVRVAVSLVLAGSLFASSAHAQPERTCILLGIVDVQPATVEIGPWLHAAGGWRSTDEAIASLGGGVDATFGLATAGQDRQYGGPVEIRIGPWLGFETPLGAARGEGGLTMTLGQTRHARWGTFGARFGAGYGTGDLAHLAAVLWWGVRNVPGRAGPTRGVCDPPAPAPAVALASGARLFGALRRELGGGYAHELVFGLELEPTFLLPPYSGSKWIGFLPN